MNIWNKSILLFASLALLTSCDPGVTFNGIIQNDSSYDLQVIIYPDTPRNWYFNYADDSLVVTSSEQRTVFEYSGLGQNSDFETCDAETDSIIVRVVGNDSLNLNLNAANADNWHFWRIKSSFQDGGECECRLIITDQMIQ